MASESVRFWEQLNEQQTAELERQIAQYKAAVARLAELTSGLQEPAVADLVLAQAQIVSEALEHFALTLYGYGLMTMAAALREEGLPTLDEQWQAFALGGILRGKDFQFALWQQTEAFFRLSNILR